MTRGFVNLALHYSRLAPYYPRFFASFLLYLSALINKRPVMIVYVPYAGHYTYVGPILDEAAKGPRPLVLFAARFNDPTRPQEAIAKKGFSSLTIFHYPLVRLIPRCDVFITPTQFIHYWPRKTRHIVCIFHGLPSKGNTFKADSMKLFTDLFFVGPSHRKMYEEKYLSQNPNSRINTHDVGYPRLDALLSGRLDPSDFRIKYNVPDDKPVVVYAPSFEEGTSLRENGVAIIEKLLELPATILVKPHPMLYGELASMQFTGGIDWFKEIESIGKTENFRHVTDLDLTPCLAVADVMVTDVSGAALEFMMATKPVVFFDCPRFYFEYLPRFWGIDGNEALKDITTNAGRDYGVVVKNFEEMNEAVLMAIKGRSTSVLPRPEELVYNPGRGGQRAWRILADFMGLT